MAIEMKEFCIEMYCTPYKTPTPSLRKEKPEVSIHAESSDDGKKIHSEQNRR